MTRTVVVLLALLATVLNPAASGAATPPVERGVTAQVVYQTQVLTATNRHRVQHQRVALRPQACVQRFAVRQARRMADQERMFHQDLGPILRRCGLSMVGENVAYGYPDGRSVVDDGWMESEGHRENILNPRFRVIGIGARKSDDGTWYASQVFGRRTAHLG